MAFDLRKFVDTVGEPALRGLTVIQIETRHGISNRAARKVRALVAGQVVARGDHAKADDKAVAKSAATTYTYDAQADQYHFEGPSGKHVMSGPDIRAMISDYVEDGGNLSMQEVAVKHGVTRREFERFKAALGVTKKHEPFTPETIASEPEDVLHDKTMAGKRRRLAMRAQKADLTTIRGYASKWVALQDGVLDPFEGVCERYAGGPLASEAALPAPRAPGAVLVHLHASDLHFGSLGSKEYGGPGYNRAEAADRFMRFHADALAWMRTAYGSNVESVVCVAGGDMAHADNIQGKTSSTKNQMDMDGLPEEVLVGAIDLYIKGVEAVLAAGYKVRIEVVPGNHDYYTSIAIGKAAALYFRNDERVTVGNLIKPYTYLWWGKCAILLHHGHGLATAKALADQLSAHARREGQGYRWGYAVTGNLHHWRTEEDPGITLVQQPSPCEPDRYASLGGWTTSRPACVALAFSAERGLIDQHYVAFD